MGSALIRDYGQSR